MHEVYENDRLYCPTCKEQPGYFLEIVLWQLKKVTPDGDEISDVRNVEYQCPNCAGEADLGWELNQ
jgi:hypothetical protein